MPQFIVADRFNVDFDWVTYDSHEQGIYRPDESEQADFESVAIDAIKIAAENFDTDQDSVTLLEESAALAMDNLATKRAGMRQGIDCTVSVELLPLPDEVQE